MASNLTRSSAPWQPFGSFTIIVNEAATECFSIFSMNHNENITPNRVPDERRHAHQIATDKARARLTTVNTGTTTGQALGERKAQSLSTRGRVPTHSC
ncbi:hypothetical protein RRG08_050040 [Elysia crispata]|uniref:Uncharacterized protein n=1 Tax=Elysia crispata TaxID=231223 RepID=A0AAE1EC45_9GAST|nr:hypothetical protein RRG08_050040 [Elysia crispata]